ncbi:MAG: prepilin-type N-terminal cleavage/methylation domain-containing protein [Verrucomicrobia bacterium]|nr:prepilin-type N-terminal cleavage/methylation domain-containing protein [Verrucomicrobiota bacterium]MCH8527365.1 prepilin-type N-terminal cleavage/methylation domain-containing protein [Kiritimatiellia bacterium]
MRRRGFTLLEILLALSILSIISVMIFGSFRSIVESVTATEEAMESLHHGEIVFEQLVSSMRSAAYFDSNPEAFTFLHEPGLGNPPDDMLSWVTGTMAFLPPRYPTRQGLNRIFLSIEDIDGQRGLAVSAYPHLLNPEDDQVEEIEPWMISPRVKGLRARFYDMRTEEWVDEWEDERQIPQILEITLFMEPLEERGPLREIVRRIDIPVARLSREVRRGRRAVGESTAGAEDGAGATRGEPSNRPPQQPRGPSRPPGDPR